MKIKVFQPTAGFREWCGPTALSILTGRTLGFCAKLGADARNRTRQVFSPWAMAHGVRKTTPKMIKGMANHEMLVALNHMGFKYEKIPSSWRGKTLFRVMEEMATKDWRSAILFNVTDHYVVTQLGQVIDNHCTDGMDYRKFWCRKRKVVCGWIVTAK